MICCVRVDNRLIHGQVTETWLPYLSATRVVVADDEAASNPLTRAAMGLCLPPQITIAVEPLSSADLAPEERRSERVLLLVREVSGAAAARGRGLQCDQLNLGNVHFGPDRRRITNSVFLSDAELDSLRSLAAAGMKIDLRAVPKDKPLGLEEIASRACLGPGQP